MAYNRKLFLKRVIEVQELALKYTNSGVTQKFIYDNHVRDTYNISYSTFSNWMGIPAKSDLKKMEETGGTNQ